MSTLVIVESPKKAQKIQQFLGKGYTVVACFGHVVDLPTKTLGVNISSGNFEPTYQTTPGKAKVLAKLRLMARSSNGRVVLATDPDKEGEAMAWHLASCLKIDKKEKIRAHFREISHNAIHHAMGNLTEIDEHIVEAQKARRILDRIIGYTITPLLWKAHKRGELTADQRHTKLSAGRVMSAALNMIFSADYAASGNIPNMHWSIRASMCIKESICNEATLVCTDRTSWLETEVRVCEVLKTMGERNTGELCVWDVHHKTVYDQAPAPFTTSSLQQHASKQLGMGLARTMQLAQDLYEGGFITYMRTDSTRLSTAAVQEIGKLVRETYGDADHVPRQWLCSKSGDRSQDAHEAIRPVDASRRPDEAIISVEHSKLYGLIWKRATASQMAHAEYIQQTLLYGGDMCVEGFCFTSSKRYLQKAGYLKVYSGLCKEEYIMPPIVSIGNPVSINDDIITAHPEVGNIVRRLDFAGLVRRMETTGVGRPSTYAPTITKLIDSGMIEVRDYKGNETTGKRMSMNLKTNILSTGTISLLVGTEMQRLVPTPLGRSVIKWLESSGYGWLIEPDFTAMVECRLDEVVCGKGRRQLLQDIWARMPSAA